MFTLRIETGNDAFADNLAEETARILRWIAERLDADEMSGPVYDSNGNAVGEYGFSTLLTKRRGDA